jgi:uncharacterized protein YndB with AHSA1/START domain
MHLLTEKIIEIARPVESVYAYTTNLEHFSEWFPAVLSVTSIDARAHADPGKEYLETVKNRNGSERKIKIQVKQSERNALFVSEGDYAPLLPRMEIAFKSLGQEKCSVTWRMYSRNGSLLARFFLLPIARKVMAQRAAAGVVRLRDRLESR